MIKNTQGEIFYGLHFYPGVAEYQDPEKGPYRVFLNEQTLRDMDSTFKGKPIFVEHVDGVTPSLDKLREEADGWVVKSFYNAADGKHWVEFIIVSERGLKAVASGMRLSNAYHLLNEKQGGLWNGVEYVKEITAGEYEHLAIVTHPRYDESVIMTPEQFKKYNNDHQIQLARLANSKDQEKGESKMGLSFFKREKVTNSVDLESTSVVLPLSKKEMTINELVAAHDKIVNMHGYASADHMVKVGENEMSVGDLVKKHMDACNEMDEMKKAANAKTEDGGEPGKGADDDEKKNDEEYGEDKEEKALDRGGDKSLNDEKEEMKEDAKKKANALKNAGPKFNNEKSFSVDLPSDKVSRGKSLFGSN